ncbi:MAG TPA: GAF domain-containing protein [Solirubrobacterales bacterium]|nr:GAF domain-containing protein [Solirubrobacterales bacterium]
MTKKKEPVQKRGLNQFTKDVLYAALVSVTAKALVWAAVLLGALLVAFVLTGWDVPAWALVAMAFVALLLVYLTRRVTGREIRELRPKITKQEDELDRHDSYGSNLCSVLDTFQKINAGDIDGVTMSSFIERGILNPARDIMRENGHPHDLRMSVLLVSEGHFQMAWAAGHSIESQRKYRVPIEKTISKIAYDKKVIQVWKNAPEEERAFEKNPKATRDFKAMVSIPILMGDKTQGVFNIVTDREGAFDPADINYLTSLGSIIQLAFGMAVKELKTKPANLPRRPESPAQAGVTAPPKAWPILPRAAPGRGVGSSDTADGTEVSDE